MDHLGIGANGAEYFAGLQDEMKRLWSDHEFESSQPSGRILGSEEESKGKSATIHTVYGGENTICEKSPVK